MRRALAILVSPVLLVANVFAQSNAMRVDLDATDAPRHLLHTHLTIPAQPGPMTLLYPEWIPGEHGPTGPVNDLAGLKIQANGQTIAWTRDPVNMYAFHITVPSGASAVDVAFDLITPPESGGFSSGSSATTELAVLSWNQVLLYPEGVAADQLRLQASLRVPDGWRYGTALPIASESGNNVVFETSSLSTLIDSPVSTGAHYRTIELGMNGSATHYVHLAADSDRALEMSPSQVDELKNLVAEASKLFNSYHYRSYHFLFTLSDHVASFGLEHHESSDDRVAERTLLDSDLWRVTADLLPHEFVHSWNGKYRRPEGLVTKDYSEPMKGNLLWVYEGLTQYLGEVLAARAGLQSQDDLRDGFALMAAALDHESGRDWRPLEDTAVAAQLLYDARGDYAGYRRGVDFYEEGALLWLDVDVTIRQLSKGSKSLDDFCRSFHGGPSGAPALKPYTFEDVVAGLNAVQPYDWATFLHARVDSIEPHPPLGGLENGGWKLAYDSSRSELWNSFENDRKGADLRYSIGLSVKDDGTVTDVTMGGPAQKAGIAPAVKLIAVNNRQFNETVLREAIQHAASSPEPIALLTRSGEYFSVHTVDYHGGEKYPHLVRDESKPDLLSQIGRSAR